MLSNRADIYTVTKAVSNRAEIRTVRNVVYKRTDICTMRTVSRRVLTYGQRGILFIKELTYVQ
jgi:hypothetical protein